MKRETFLYHYDFWSHGSIKRIFMNVSEEECAVPPKSGIADKISFISVKMEPELENKIKKEYSGKVDWNEIRLLVDRKIIQPGRIKGMWLHI
jgi:hypothetical protein